MSMEQLMALVPLEAALSVRDKGRKTRWERIKPRKGNSRFGPVDEKPFLPPPFIDLPKGLSPWQLDCFLREQRCDELHLKLHYGELECADPEIRPPSPPPIYDKNGSRINTREVRIRQAMNGEYQRLCEFMIKNVPGYIPPLDYKPTKKIRRIEIPLAKYPEYNFMGIIIGPRGCNHKRLEAESGTTISIRGEGTQKEGKRDHQTDEEAQMPMHVHISGDTEEAVELAVSLIEPLLDPLHPAHEEFKKRGLEQLALVNGVTYGEIDRQRCAICQAVGHLAADCPDAGDLQNFKKPQIRCAICGDLGHVTMDCKFRKPGAPLPPEGRPPPPPPPPPGQPSKVGQSPYQNLHDQQKMDMEYRKMMSELTGESSPFDEPDTLTNEKGFYTAGNANANGNKHPTPPPGLSPSAPGTSPSGSPPPPPPPPFDQMRWNGSGPSSWRGRAGIGYNDENNIQQGTSNNPGTGTRWRGQQNPCPSSPNSWNVQQMPRNPSPAMAGGVWDMNNMMMPMMGMPPMMMMAAPWSQYGGNGVPGGLPMMGAGANSGAMMMGAPGTVVMGAPGAHAMMMTGAGPMMMGSGNMMMGNVTTDNTVMSTTTATASVTNNENNVQVFPPSMPPPPVPTLSSSAEDEMDLSN